MNEEILQILNETGAVLQGHFLLSSGKHSKSYVQCAKLLRYPNKAEIVIKKALENLAIKPNIVVGPAMGGVIVSYEVGRQLGTEAIFTERVENVMQLRRGFELKKGAKVLITEDVLTTGKSTLETIKALKEYEPEIEIIGVLCIVNRISGKAPFDYPIYSAIRLNIETYEESECPLCKTGSTPVKPGSRKFYNK
jgi:orotate phosphoribosyltransferase